MKLVLSGFSPGLVRTVLSRLVCTPISCRAVFGVALSWCSSARSGGLIVLNSGIRPWVDELVLQVVNVP